jgi:hypothetical protein
VCSAIGYPPSVIARARHDGRAHLCSAP